jgi:catechol 2,3-dioxygenase-like lactoylglutathione lyase family enzyme
VTAARVRFVGVRVADPEAYEATVTVYRDQLGLRVVLEDGRRSTRFTLGDGTALHVYGPDDLDHVAFGDRACIGLEVDDLDAARAGLEAAGLAILDDIERNGTSAWFHYRAPDGSVQELVGPDRTE